MVTLRPKRHTSEDLSKKMSTTIVEDNDSKPNYICNDCGISLDLLPDDTWFCSICKRTYLPEVQEVRKDVDFYIPADNKHNKEPAIISIDYNDDVRIKKPPNYQGSFKQLAARGIRITSYDVRDGAGRPMREDEED